MKHYITIAQDLLLALFFICAVALSLGGSFKKGECEAEVSPMLCIPVYKLPSFQQVN
ncbi:hypothetical protein [Moraxella sp. ZY210820]|uniref:hypothetical protein n=1 Tax=Moraxella sp. ZY210820 TaxID=2904123 RepID=UPI002731F309|nr:hypothetical protein [Moraxella sp. ZY210820]WLF84806.1 hypothetical protein LU301_04915 [Moraxella sp. ZY210820]